MSTDLEKRLTALEQQVATLADVVVDEGTRRMRARMAEDRANAEAHQAEVDRDMREMEAAIERFRQRQAAR